jgi:hypothetical protein
MRQYADELLNRHIGVTSRWIRSEAQSDPLSDPDACAEAAAECFADVDAAQTVIYFAEHGSVGKHVELGYAIARGKKVVVVGTPTSVFHFTLGVIRVDSWAQILSALACPHEDTYTNIHGDEECRDCGEINVAEE